MLLEDEVLELDVNELVYDYQGYGVRTAVKYGLCEAIKNGYNNFMVNFIDTYNNVSFDTTVVDSNNHNVIINSNEFTEILEQYYFSVAPATNSEVGVALLDVINRLFIKCVEYTEEVRKEYDEDLINYYNF